MKISEGHGMLWARKKHTQAEGGGWYLGLKRTKRACQSLSLRSTVTKGGPWSNWPLRLCIWRAKLECSLTASFCLRGWAHAVLGGESLETQITLFFRLWLYKEWTVVLLGRDVRCEGGNVPFRSSSGLAPAKFKEELHLNYTLSRSCASVAAYDLNDFYHFCSRSILFKQYKF